MKFTKKVPEQEKEFQIQQVRLRLDIQRLEIRTEIKNKETGQMVSDRKQVTFKELERIVDVAKLGDVIAKVVAHVYEEDVETLNTESFDRMA